MGKIKTLGDILVSASKRSDYIRKLLPRLSGVLWITKGEIFLVRLVECKFFIENSMAFYIGIDDYYRMLENNSKDIAQNNFLQELDRMKLTDKLPITSCMIITETDDMKFLLPYLRDKLNTDKVEYLLVNNDDELMKKAT